ncbi:ROK family protein [soil metagenome]
MKSPSIVLDLGGTLIKLALVRENELLAVSEIQVSDHTLLKPFLPIIEEKVMGMAKTCNISEREFAGIGMAFPSIVDSNNGKILSDYVKYKDTNDLNLHHWAKSKYNAPILLENDSRAALIGEWQYGAGLGYNNIVLITIGTGVGSAVLLDGKILRGKHYLAGNLGGHITINYKGKTCNCGNIGCLESVASTWAIPDLVKQHPDFKSSDLSKENYIDFEALFRLATAGDSLARTIRDECINAWSFGVVNLIHSFDPEIVIVGGGVMKSKELILPFIQDIVDRHIWLAPGTINIKPAKCENHAALLGMDFLIRSKK